jgi:uncharacterized Ntn-hydrolase superfamily protein
MTYSIVARDPQTGAFGVGVQSHFFAVGSVVPWVEAGVGAVATQARAQLSYGPLGLERMRAGEPANVALAALVAADPASATRQVAMIDNTGRAVAHNGLRCIAHAGALGGTGWVVQANMARNPTILNAMADAYHGTTGDFPDRLLAALDAAEADGGDIRGKQSAALVVSSTAADGSVSAESVLRLHVEDHERPLTELRRLLDMHRAYRLLSSALDRAQAGNIDDVLPALERALTFAPDNDEIQFWYGGLLTVFGDPRGRPLLDRLYATNPGWRELVPRLVAAGVIPDLPGVVERLT